MNNFEKFIVRIWGHSNDFFGLIIVPTLIYTVIIVALVFMFPERKWFFIGVWWATGCLQILGTLAALKIKLRHNKPK